MGGLTPVSPNSDGVEKMVSVLVSVLDPSSTNSLLHKQLEVVPVVGLEPTRLFTVPGF